MRSFLRADTDPPPLGHINYSIRLFHSIREVVSLEAEQKDGSPADPWAVRSKARLSATLEKSQISISRGNERNSESGDVATDETAERVET